MLHSWNVALAELDHTLTAEYLGESSRWSCLGHACPHLEHRMHTVLLMTILTAYRVLLLLAA